MIGVVRVASFGGFERVRRGRASLLVRSEDRDWLVPLLTSVASACADCESGIIPEGRGGARLLRVGDEQVVVRSCRRGGLPGRILSDLYFGCTARPFREIQTIELLRRHGVPVVVPLAACVRWVGPGCYRGWVVTRYIPHARTLWSWASDGSMDIAHGVVWRRVGAAIRRLHDAGARHPDLNLRNILLRPGEGGPEVVFVDFDRPWVAGWRTAAADLARLERSARKLDPGGRRVTAEDLQQLRAAYDDTAGQ